MRVEKSSGRRGVLRKGVLLARLPLLPTAVPEVAAMGEAKGDSGESSEEEETLAAVRL